MRYIFLFINIFWCSVIFGQDTRHEAWFRLGINGWNKNIGYTLELQHRTQSNHHVLNDNRLSHPLKTIIRPFVHLKLKRDWMVSLSPISYTKTAKVLDAQGSIRSINDFRTTFGIQKSINIKSIQLRNRLWYELRMRNINVSYYFSTRARLQTAVTIPVYKTINYQIINELFVANDVGFDQNRLYNGLQICLKKQDINLGYQMSRHDNKPTTHDRHQLVINLNIKL